MTGDEFEPSFRILLRIMKVILEKDSIGRTALSVNANVNYGILSKHIEWMKNKSLIELTIEGNKINVKLSFVGRDLASNLVKLID